MDNINQQNQQEEKNIYGYIYKTTIHDEDSELNNCYYIGQHKWNKNEIDLSYFGSGIILNDYILSNGTNNLICEIIEYANSKSELNNLEKIYVNENTIKDSLCINLCVGGEGGDKFSNFSEEKMNQYKNKMSLLSKKLWENEEYRDKVLMGRHNAAVKQWSNPEIREKTINGIRKAFKDGTLSKKISDIKKKQCEDLEYRKKLSKIVKESMKDRDWYNNGTLQAYIKKEDVPKDWVKGKLYDKIPKEWKYYSNGIFQVRYKECPEGFKCGKTGSIKKYIKKSEKINKIINLNYEKKSKHEKNKEKVVKKISQKKKEYYQDENHRKEQSERRKKILESPKEREKISKTLKDLWNSRSDEYKKEYSDKIKERVNEDTRKKLSESAKGRSYYNNGTLQIYVKKEDVPSGWVKGKLYDKIPEDWKYYNNGKLTVRALECPEGFKLGKYTNSSEYRQLKKNKCQ